MKVLKRILVMLCICAITSQLLLGSSALGSDYGKQSAEIKTGWEDPNEGYPIDIKALSIADDGSNLYLILNFYKPINKDLLTSYRIFFFLDTDQNKNTGLATPTSDGLGIERVVELFNVVNGGQEQLSLYIHNWQQGFGGSEDVAIKQGGEFLIAAMPLSMLGNPSKFNWRLVVRRVDDSKTYDGKNHDTIPDRGYKTYAIGENSISSSGSTTGGGNSSGSNNQSGGGSPFGGGDLFGAGPGGGGPGGGPGDLESADDDSKTLGSKTKPDSKSLLGGSSGVNIFADIKPSDWFYTYVLSLANASIVNGYGNNMFIPNGQIKRAEFCKMILAALGKTPADGNNSSFKDAANHWAKGYIQKAKELGIATGYPDGSFRPDGPITRAELSKMSCIAFGLTTSSSVSGFADCKGHWADNYISTLKTKSILSGYAGNTFKPEGKATRSEVCKIIFLLMEGS